MGGLFGGGSNAQKVPRYTGLSIQTSARGMCIPVGWGRFRASTNLIWFGGFEAHSSGGKGGKGGGGKGSQSYTYTCALIMSLCEGPISNVGTIWVDQGVSTLGSLNLGLATGTAGQTPPSFMSSTYPAAARSYAYTAYVASALYQLGASPSPPSHNFEIIGKYSGTMPDTVDANPADIIDDMITSTQYGLDSGATYLDAATLAAYKTYCEAQGLFLSPYLNQQEQGKSILQRWAQLTNSWIVWSGTSMKFIPLTSVPVTGNGVTYTPNITPIFDFGYADFVADSGKDPITVTRSDPRDGYNRVQLDVKDRSNAYNDNPILWEDSTSVDLYGQLQAQIVSASEVCENNIGYVMAALIGQRAVYIRNTYDWKCQYGVAVLLEPGDIVTITVPELGLNRFPVRIQSVKEDDKGALSITAEEFPAAIGQVTLYPPQDNGGSGIPNQFEDPGLINPPLIIEPPLEITGGVPQLWIGASGGANWGGAQLYISPDGTNYALIGTINVPTAQGTLTSTLASHSDPDLTDTLALDTGESVTMLSTAVTQAMADAFQTASLVDEEILSYGTCSLTGTYTWALTYLRRGGYGTAPASHSAGAQWWQINPGAVVKYTLPQSYVGQTLYFKATSYNTFGNETESLADVTAYPYVVSGSAFSIDPPSSCSLAAVTISGVLSMVASWGASDGPYLGTYEAQLSADSGATWTAGDVIVGSDTLQYTFAPALTSTNYQARVRAISQNGQAISIWAVSSVVNSGTAGSPPLAPSTLSAAAGSGSNVVLSIGSSAGATGYPIFRGPGLGTPIGSTTLLGTASSTTYTDTTSIGGSSYTYYAEAQNAYGNSPPSTDATITLSASTTLTSGGTILTAGGTTLIL